MNLCKKRKTIIFYSNSSAWVGRVSTILYMHYFVCTRSKKRFHGSDLFYFPSQAAYNSDQRASLYQTKTQIKRVSKMLELMVLPVRARQPRSVVSHYSWDENEQNPKFYSLWKFSQFLENFCILRNHGRKKVEWWETLMSDHGEEGEMTRGNEKMRTDGFAVG